MSCETTPADTNPVLFFLKQHRARAAPLVYIYVTVMGTALSAVHFRAFGIDVIEFAEVDDFLLAPFRDPSSVLFVVVATIHSMGAREMLDRGLAEFTVAIRERIAKRFERLGHRFPLPKRFLECAGRRLHVFVRVPVPVVAPLATPFLPNDGYGAIWRTNRMGDPERAISVQLVNRAAAPSGEAWLDGPVLVGTTDSIVFFARALQPPGRGHDIHSEFHAARPGDAEKDRCLSSAAQDYSQLLRFRTKSISNYPTVRLI